MVYRVVEIIAKREVQEGWRKVIDRLIEKIPYKKLATVFYDIYDINFFYDIKTYENL